MNREEVRNLINQGRANEVAQIFRGFDHDTTPEYILQLLSNSKSPSISDAFPKVLSIMASESTDTNMENSKRIRDQLKTFIPLEVVEKQNWSEEVSKYLEDQKLTPQLFNQLWEALKLTNRNDLEIGVAWLGALTLST